MLNKFCYIANNGILLSNKKERTTDVCNNTGKSYIVQSTSMVAAFR